MNLSSGLVNLLLGVAYTGLAFLAIDEMRKLRATRGPSRFGLAWTLMALTCGPHHLAHALHVQQGAEHATTWELIAVLISLPPAAIFVALRIEAIRGGRGDRLVLGTPRWLVFLPTGIATLAGIVLYEAIHERVGLHALNTTALLSLPLSALLIVMYVWVGWCLFRTQVRRRRDLEGWSLSGLSLALVFPTCALTHAAYGLAGANDIHTLVIDIVAIPAAAYFLYVVRSLYLENSVDWNRTPLIGRAGTPQRPAPWAEHRAATPMAVDA